MNSSAPDSPSGTLERAGGSALGAVLPELGAIRAARGTNRRLVTVILAGTALFCVIVAVAVFMLLGQEAKTARHAATGFGAALVHDDASAAPQGASDDVAGVRGYFGPVSSATVIATHNHAVNTGDADTRNYYVADLLLHTRRGPAVVELSFDNHSLSSEEVTGIRELSPSDAPSLSATESAQLRAAFAARGGHAADGAMLSSGAGPAPVAHTVTPAAVIKADPALSTAAEQLSCVQRAHGDVAKLQACTA